MRCIGHMMYMWRQEMDVIISVREKLFERLKYKSKESIKFDLRKKYEGVDLIQHQLL
jgi:hypothetical protein